MKGLEVELPVCAVNRLSQEWIIPKILLLFIGTQLPKAFFQNPMQGTAKRG